MAAERQPLADAQRGVVARDLLDRLDGREEAAREDVLVDPRVRAPGRQHPVVRHHDGLEADLAAGRQDAVEGLEVRRPELVPDRLDHLDRDDGVVRRALLDGAVVAEVHAHPVGHAGRRDPVAGQGLLLGGQGDRADASAAAGGADGQLAPAGADLEQAGAVADAGGVEQPVDLAGLRLGQRLGGGLAAGRDGDEMSRRRRVVTDRGVEQGRGVAQRLVEERREEVVRQVVVVGDVVAAVGLRAALRARRAGDHQGAGLLQRRGDQRGQVGGEHGEEAGQVPGVPGLGEVGLAEADEAVPARAGRRTRRAGARSWRDHRDPAPGCDRGRPRGAR